jgi:phosphoglycolate phosphatase
MTAKLAVFDLDGTLVDSRRSIGEAMALAFAGIGLDPPTYDQTRRIVGLSLVPAIKVLAPDLREERYPALAEAYRQAFITNRENGLIEPLYEGAEALIRRLKAQGWLLGVATGKVRRGVDHFLDRHGFRDLFDAAHCAEDGPGKPHPHMLLLNLKAVDVAAADAVMIGDTSFDMIMARDAGCLAQGVSWGFHTPAEIEEGGAHHIAHDMQALGAALDAFAAQGWAHD